MNRGQIILASIIITLELMTCYEMSFFKKIAVDCNTKLTPDISIKIFRTDEFASFKLHGNMHVQHIFT